MSWGLRLPSKLKIFAYLADIDRLSTRTNLFSKSCAPLGGLRGLPVGRDRQAPVLRLSSLGDDLV
jgi:hypothetical protein